VFRFPIDGFRVTVCVLAVALAAVCFVVRADPTTDDESPDTDADEEWDARIAVTAELPESTSAPLGASSTVITPEESSGTPSNLTDLVVASPSVSQNGQGGHFQVFSVRGVSRQRVMNLVSGMRINSERRAGVSVSFVDPLLMGSVEILRGPSTTLHGSGALGGVVQVTPQVFDGWVVHAGYDTRGDENYQVVGFGVGKWSVGLARRDAGDAEAADGTVLNSHFTQYSATLARNWSSGPRRYQLLFIPTLADDIGKANTDFPERTTNYPLERHQMLKFSIDSENGWQLDTWVHGQDLETEVFEMNARAQVVSDSLDYGVRWERRERWSEGPALRWGLQATGRHDVDAVEMGQPPSLDDAREIEAGAFATLHWTRPATEYEIGARLSGQEQENTGFPDEDLTAMNGFVGATRRFGERVRLRGSLSSGLRYPSLSERFFTGTTGAGTIIGNPDLDAERSLSGEISLRWLGRHTLVHTAVYRNEVDDYIERVPLATDIRTFVNLVSGTLQGAELQIVVLPRESWNVTLGGHVTRGRADDGAPLADVPPHQLYAGARYRRGAWTLSARLAHRLPKTDPARGELSRDAADELRASVEYGFGGLWSLAVSGSNLFDEEYFFAADEKAPLAAERSFGLHLVRRSVP